MTTSSNEFELTVRLLERRRFTATSDDTAFEDCTVHCPLSAGAQPVNLCRRCQRFEREVQAEGQAWLECRGPVGVAFPRGVCGELMSPEVTCLDSELGADRAVRFLEMSGVTSAPVLDDNAVLVGVVSCTSLARIRADSMQVFEVEDAMTTEVVTLFQHSTLGEAARLMTAHHLDRVPIVTEDGHLVGVISAMDLVRWLAGRTP